MEHGLKKQGAAVQTTAAIIAVHRNGCSQAGPGTIRKGRLKTVDLVEWWDLGAKSSVLLRLLPVQFVQVFKRKERKNWNGVCITSGVPEAAPQPYGLSLEWV